MPAGFAVPLGHKDIRLTRVAAKGLRVAVRLVSRLHGRFSRLRARHGNALDWSMGVFAATDAGEIARGATDHRATDALRVRRAF